ncbi:MAG: hypothetical protein A2W61_03130 [Deltaproteobacteria bacterium RIFCSPLOWO2_01_44_7]|nr:MAG: hypothetical protein A2712_02610 [Deltaproteobacteria bacterium RIFCSPHIGHO2_01_FULL_43_49]OGQ16088.1 MAG: hypothetical protein A3D22_00580 [Deltaproteobacteria bacterium RIFCSPHIGHO2_02_FULL_44_53]OGQ29049.1 MAG: hypothetical protein A3D98_04365 [Deltaproteobacteria bacterium RIFCSPHIGHO2_12_FULL_44_21]OGQ32605.1 MAG: hypothetical protein A2979_08510 [Deltaproteobacteria bacterium RIFCSPLOWO2_01_FULL_45_74]OGQ38347.1 MAG: hypothetical protein A2W61_03130 [Deltaproteobacteria bacterium 
MSVVFVGTVEFSRFALRGLLDARAPLSAIFTLDTSLQGPVSDFAIFDNLLKGTRIPLFQVCNLHSTEVVQTLREIQPDFIYVIGWSRIVHREILETAKRGGIGLHPTLLPEGRGRAPIPWTILKGLRKSGVSLFHLSEAPDAGDIISQVSYDIAPEETATTLYQKVCETTYRLVKETYPLLAGGKALRLKQDESRATHWVKRTPQDGLIDWRKSSHEIETLVRAVTHPYPGAFSYLRGKKVLVWKARRIETQNKAVAGTILSDNGEGMIVKTGDGALLLESIQETT